MDYALAIKPITEGSRKGLPEFSKRLKWSLIVNQLEKDQDIKVEPEEIKEHTATQLRLKWRLWRLILVTTSRAISCRCFNSASIEKTRDAIMEELNSFFNQIKSIKDKKLL